MRARRCIPSRRTTRTTSKSVSSGFGDICRRKGKITRRRLVALASGSNRIMKKIIATMVLLMAAACATSSSGTMTDLAFQNVTREDRSQADAYYHFMLGDLLEQEGDYDNALKEYQAAAELDPRSAEIMLGLSSTQLHKGRIDLATEYAKKAAELAPDKTDALLMLGSIYTSRRKYEEAVDV